MVAGALDCGRAGDFAKGTRPKVRSVLFCRGFVSDGVENPLLFLGVVKVAGVGVIGIVFFDPKGLDNRVGLMGEWSPITNFDAAAFVTEAAEFGVRISGGEEVGHLVERGKDLRFLGDSPHGKVHSTGCSAILIKGGPVVAEGGRDGAVAGVVGCAAAFENPH